jgi:cytochrome c2
MVSPSYTFREFITNPAAKVPGTMMLLAVTDEKEIGDLWPISNGLDQTGRRNS